MPDAPITWQDAAVALGFATVIAFAVSQLAARLVQRALQQPAGTAEATAAGIRRYRRPVRIIQACIFLGLLVAMTGPALEMAGFQATYGIPLETAIRWFFEVGLRVLVIAVLAYFAMRAARLAIGHLEEIVQERAGGAISRIEVLDRVRTLGSLVGNAVNVIIFAAATLMILREFGLDITPLLTGAGIAGLAVGFGAQHLVRDVISGFFLILEDQVNVGDVVRVNGTEGQVESIKLRTITLRDVSGTVHTIPNGAITALSNMTKDFSYAVLDVGITYSEDVDRVSEILRQVGTDLRGDPEVGRFMLEPLEILGIESFGDWKLTIRMRVKTLPARQGPVSRELKFRIKKAFDAHSIETPFPFRSMPLGPGMGPSGETARDRKQS